MCGIHVQYSNLHICVYSNRQFIAEKLPPIQFKNPDVQMVTFKSATPTPIIKIYFGELHNIKYLYMNYMQIISESILCCSGQ